MLKWTITVIAELGPHQTSLHHAKSANVHQQGEFHNLEDGDGMDNQQEVAYRHSTQMEVVIEEEVTQYMSKLMKKLCNEKLMI